MLAEIDVSAKDFLAELFKTDGDTSFEELGCIGYDPAEDAVVGVFTVKRPSGYSGGPCTAGSTEHVAFWVDWGSGWEHVGTTATTVHDEDVPDGGLHYSVYHPLGSWAHRRACSDGPVQPRLRAILSWQQAPPPGDPDWRPTWGNREETTFELPAGAVTPLAPVLESVSGYAACQIDPASGHTIVHQRPFGGGISIAGFIPGAPDRSSPPMKYKLIARQIGSGGAVLATEVLDDDFTVWVTESVGGAPPTQYPVDQVADAGGWFTYLDDPDPSGHRLAPRGRQPALPVVVEAEDRAVGGRAPGQGPVRHRVRRAGHHLPGQHDAPAGAALPRPGGSRRRRRDHELPDAGPAVDPGGLVHEVPGRGDPRRHLLGDRRALRQHRVRRRGHRYSATTPGGTPRWTVTGATAYPAASTGGTSGTWEFDTAGMPACGYVLRSTAYDRTVNGAGGWRDDDVEGFSLE